MKTIAKVFIISLFVFSINQLFAQDYNYANYLKRSSPAIQASEQLASQVDGWFKDIEKAGRDYQKKYPNGNAAAESRGRAYLNGLQGAYNYQQKRSNQRRKEALNRKYREYYRNAKYSRDYYINQGNYHKAKYYQHQMNIYQVK